MIHIGIDPGLSGAIGIITPEMYAVYDMPTLTIEGKKRKNKTTGKISVKKRRVYDINEVKRLLTQFKLMSNEIHYKIEMWLEDIHPMPGEGSMGAFSLGKSIMLWEASASWAEIPLEKISPIKWKNKIMSGMLKSKDASVVKASQLFPQCNFRGPRGGLLDGRAEALLITEYGRRESLLNQF